MDHRNDREFPMRVPPRAVRWSLTAAIVIAAIVGCARQPLAPVANQPAAGTYDRPLFARVITSALTTGATPTGPLVGSGDIDGAIGGEVQVGRFRVIVPPGAIADSATITITIPDPDVVSCQLSISPPGANSFAVPVSLVADCAGVTNVDLHNCGTLWFDPSAGVWRTVAGTAVDLDHQTVTAKLPHFSDYGVADLLEGRAGW